MDHGNIINVYHRTDILADLHRQCIRKSDVVRIVQAVGVVRKRHGVDDRIACISIVSSTIDNNCLDGIEIGFNDRE